MTCDPVYVQTDCTLHDAINLMDQKNIHHLPVVDSGKVYGIISMRDIKYAQGIISLDPKTATVAELCQTHVYTASPDTLLDEVAGEMAEHHYGSAVVVQNDKLVGIFTLPDLCQALLKILHDRYHA